MKARYLQAMALHAAAANVQTRYNGLLEKGLLLHSNVAMKGLGRNKLVLNTTLFICWLTLQLFRAGVAWNLDGHKHRCKCRHTHTHTHTHTQLKVSER